MQTCTFIHAFKVIKSMFMLFMKRFWVHIAIAIVFSVAGYKLAPKPNKTVVATTKEVVAESKHVEAKTEIVKGPSVINRVITKSVDKAGKPRIIVKERIVQASITEVSSSKSEVETKAIKETKTVVASQNISRYSLGIAMAPTKIMQPRLSDAVVDIGIRLGNLPLWATASYGLQSKATIGVRFEF